MPTMSVVLDLNRDDLGKTVQCEPVGILAIHSAEVILSAIPAATIVPKVNSVRGGRECHAPAMKADLRFSAFLTLEV